MSRTKRVIDNIDLMGGAVIDYDEDGWKDILCAYMSYNPTTASLALYRNLGGGSAWEKSVLYTEVSIFLPVPRSRSHTSPATGT